MATRASNYALVPLCAILILFGGGRAAQAQSAKLAYAEKPIMVNCGALANGPCFRLKFNIIDEKGASVPVELPDQLASRFTIRMGDRTVTPFFASADSGKYRPRIALILIDVSGSMNTRLKNGQTRFDAAKAGASIFLDGFKEGVDRLAVVPFGSQHVQETINAAHFATTKAEASEGIRDLPTPQPKTNTALFSAVSDALDRLRKVAQDVPGSPETVLLVMTDGQNDVQRGDDPDLLAGYQGLQTVARKVQNSGLQVYAIGFGKKNEIDETALSQIGTKYNMTEDPGDLKQLFKISRGLLNSRIWATLESPWTDRASLAGRTFAFKADLQVPNGAVLHSDQITWSTPQMGIPPFQGECDEAEKRALLTRPKPPDTGWVETAILRPALVFAGLSLLLVALWFGLPRLFWPARYEQQGVALRPDRWVTQTRAEAGAYGRKPPPGFDKGNPRAPERAPSDKTIVRPRDDFNATRTRFD